MDRGPLGRGPWSGPWTAGPRAVGGPWAAGRGPAFSKTRNQLIKKRMRDHNKTFTDDNRHLISKQGSALLPPE